MSAKCQKQTFCAAAEAGAIFDQLGWRGRVTVPGMMTPIRPGASYAAIR